MDAALQAISQSSTKTNLPTFKVGQTVRIHQRIKEGEKERIQVFEGLIIQMSNGTGINGTITVRKVVDGIGVERVFAIHSPFIAKIEITKQAKIRRSKLYYIRERTGKAARLRTTLLEGQVFTPTPFEAEEGAATEENAEQAETQEVAAPEQPSEEVKQEVDQGDSIETPDDDDEEAEMEAEEKNPKEPDSQEELKEAEQQESQEEKPAETQEAEAKPEDSEDNDEKTVEKEAEEGEKQ